MSAHGTYSRYVRGCRCEECKATRHRRYKETIVPPEPKPVHPRMAESKLFYGLALRKFVKGKITLDDMLEAERRAYAMTGEKPPLHPWQVPPEEEAA